MAESEGDGDEKIGEYRRRGDLSADCKNTKSHNSLNRCSYCTVQRILYWEWGGRNRLKLENEEGGGAHQLTLQLTVYRIYTSPPSLSTTEIELVK